MTNRLPKTFLTHLKEDYIIFTSKWGK